MSKMRPDRLETNRLRAFALGCLERLGPFTPVEADAVNAGLAEMQSLRAGAELIAEGAVLNNPHLLLEGWAMRLRALRDGRRQIIGFLLPGDAFGLCARRGGVALCSTVALTPVTVAPMPVLGDVLRQAEPTALGRLACDLLSQEETFLYNQVVRLGRQSAQERMISLLLEFHARLDQVHLTQDSSFILPLTQEVLSDALGLSVVHTNRTLQQLKREHLVASRGTSITLPDLKALAEISEFRPSPH